MDEEQELELHELRQEFVEERARIIAHERRNAFESSEEAHSLGVSATAITPGSALERSTDSARLQRLEVALEAFSQGEYGNCTQCGEPIRISRLRSNPEVSCCGLCAALGEGARD